MGFVRASDPNPSPNANPSPNPNPNPNPEQLRDITDRLDAVGNVTKAATKGYSIGSAGLACFLLFSAFMDVVHEASGLPFKSVDFAVPEVFVGGLMGGMLVFVFAGLCCQAVGNCAADVVQEVRQQFAEKPGIMDGSQLPDYSKCASWFGLGLGSP